MFKAKMRTLQSKLQDPYPPISIHSTTTEKKGNPNAINANSQLSKATRIVYNPQVLQKSLLRSLCNSVI